MCPNPQFPADLVSFTDEILRGKLHFFVLCLYEGFVSRYQSRNLLSRCGDKRYSYMETFTCSKVNK